MELVDSVDDLRSSSSTRGISMPNFEVLDARIASALNKIIHNSHFKRRISLEEQKAPKEDRFLRGRQIAYLIYDHFRVTGSHDSVGNYTDLFTIVLRNDDIQEFGRRCYLDSGGRLPGRSTEEKGGEEGEEDEGSEERTVRKRNHYRSNLNGVQLRRRLSMKVLKMKDRKQEGQTSCEAGFARRSKMKKRRKAGKNEDQMAEQWEEEQKLDGIAERRWIEGSSLNLDAMQKVLELVVNERTSQGKRVESPKDKTKVPGRSVEEMKEKPNIIVEEDTEEMRKWRGLSQSEMDQCWWHSADRMEEEVLDKYKVEECKREAFVLLILRLQLRSLKVT